MHISNVNPSTSHWFIATSLFLSSAIFMTASAGGAGHEAESADTTASGNTQAVVRVEGSSETAPSPSRGNTGPRGADDYDVIDHSGEPGWASENVPKRGAESETAPSPSRGNTGPKGADDYDVIDHSGEPGRASENVPTRGAEKENQEGEDHTDPQSHIHAGPHTRD